VSRDAVALGEVVTDDALDDRVDELAGALAAKPTTAAGREGGAERGRRRPGDRARPRTAGVGRSVRHARPAGGDGGVLREARP